MDHFSVDAFASKEIVASICPIGSTIEFGEFDHKQFPVCQSFTSNTGKFGWW